MKKHLVMLIAALMILSGTAFANTVIGKYAGTQNEGKSIWVNTKDDAGMDMKAEVWVMDAKWEGVTSTGELVEGQDLMIEAAKDDQGNWKASSVKAAAPAAAAPAQQ